MFLFQFRLSLHALLASLEEDDNSDKTSVDITIIPPTNDCDDVTDEDSGDEIFLPVLSNLPGTQLMAEAEISVHFDDEDAIPLPIIELSYKKSLHCD